MGVVRDRTGDGVEGTEGSGSVVENSPLVVDRGEGCGEGRVDFGLASKWTADGSGVPGRRQLPRHGGAATSHTP